MDKINHIVGAAGFGRQVDRRHLGLAALRGPAAVAGFARTGSRNPRTIDPTLLRRAAKALSEHVRAADPADLEATADAVCEWEAL